MKLGTLISALAILVCANAYAADTGLYGRVDSGYSWSSGGDADSSAIIGAGVGYRINEHFRVDATLGYRGWYQASESATVGGTTISGIADIKSTDGLLNAYYDIGTYGRFTPYVGAGAGIAHNTTDAAGVALNGVNVGQIGSNSRNDFAWQAGFGTAIHVADNLAIDVGYRFLDLGSAETSDTFTANNGATATGARQTADLHNSELQVGLRYSF